ncbi:GNAT family N-acetyltransferase [bacterium]|nr:GNAT family N-acetyltransferase [candidate division CSSED10-310 bacterium]
MHDEAIRETGLNFRKLNLPADREILIRIHRIYDREYGFSRDASGYEILVETLTRHGDIYHPLVLFDGSEAVGYIRAYDRLSASSCDIVIMLDLVYVLPGHRGHGIGKILLRRFLEFAASRRCARIDLLTDHDNPAAVQLYRHFGFRGRDRFQMILFLKDQPDLAAYFERRLRNNTS